MNQLEKYTIGQICEIINGRIPDKYKYLEKEYLSNITSLVNELKDRGGLFLFGSNSKNREDQLLRAIDLNVKIVFAGKVSEKILKQYGVPYIIVNDAYDAMAKISSFIRNELDIQVIGITGSLGKTTTKEILYSVFKQHYKTEKSYSNRNSTAGILLGVQEILEDTEFYIQEFGVAIGNRSMESKVNACVPTAAIITNISDSHIEVLGSRENILREKKKIITEMPKGCHAFLNYDDEMLREVRFDHHPVISYAVNNKSADYYIENLKTTDENMEFDVVHGNRSTRVKMHVAGIHNVGNAVAAFAVAEWAGIPIDRIVKGIDEYRNVGIRQTFTNIGGYKLYLDSYNAAPESMLNAVKTVEQMSVNEQGKRIAILGEMKGLGEHSERLHRETGRNIGGSNLDIIICFGNQPCKLMAEEIKKLDKAVYYTNSREELNYLVDSLITKNDIALFKGSNALLLHKTVDEVYGTAFHFDDYYVYKSSGEYRYKIASEEDGTNRVSAIVKYQGKQKAIRMEKSFEGIELSCIGRETFYGDKYLKQVVVPESVKNISESAFGECKKLNKVSLPKTLKMIERKAFYGCSKLKEIVIPDGTIHIGESAFKNCTSLRRVVIPDTVGYIGKDAFDDNSNIRFEYQKGSYADNYFNGKTNYKLLKSNICKILDIEFDGIEEEYSRLTYAKNAEPGCIALVYHELITPYMEISEKRAAQLADVAMSKGAKCLITTHQIKDYPCMIISKHVSDSAKAIVRDIRSSLDMKVIEITGSYGKTTITNMLESILSYKYSTLGHNGDSLNMFFHTVERMQAVDSKTEVFLQEAAEAPHYGVPGDIADMIMPDIGIITSVGTAHIERMGSVEDILESSLTMQRGLKEEGILLLNGDDPLLIDIKLQRKAVYYGMLNTNVDYRAVNIKQSKKGISFDIVHDKKSLHVKMPCVGVHNAQNAAAAFAVAKILGVSDNDIIRGLSDYQPEGIRQRMISRKGYNFYVDCYNASKETMCNSIDTVCDIKIPKRGSRIAVLGDIKQLGENSEAYHREVGKHVANSKLDILICLGEDSHYIAEEAKLRENLVVHVAKTHDEIVEYLKNNINLSDIVLFKASHSMELSKIPSALLGIDLEPTSQK